MKTLKIENKGKYIIAQLNRGRSNPINMEMVSEMRQVIADVENDESIQGMIITGQQNFFSVGLDILELFHYDEKEMEKFWSAFIDMVGELASFSKPLISSITGHSPAGGCILAICSDYRVMADTPKFKIGLNEVPVGIVVPSGILSLYGFWLGQGKAYQMLIEGSLLNPQDALAANLVDEILPQENVLAAAEAKMKFYLSFNPAVWTITKKSLRTKLIKDSFISQEDKQLTLKQWWAPDTRYMLKKMVGRLTKKA